jgi:chromosomal replication initiation ATPase DnaA
LKPSRPSRPWTPAFAAADEYERLATVFSRLYEETHDIALTLEVLDIHRARASMAPPIPSVADRIVAVVAPMFDVRPARRLLLPGRHRDLCAARWVASWLLRQRRWSTVKIGRFFGMDHSTVLHGLRRVATSRELLLSARAAESRLEMSDALGAA